MSATKLTVSEPTKEEVKAQELVKEIGIEQPKPVVQVPQNAIYAKIAQVFGDQADNAYKIVSTCENKQLKLDLVSEPNKDKWASRDHGLFQINDHWHKVAFESWSGKSWYPNIFDLDLNVGYAKFVFDQWNGWGAWSCRGVLG